MNKTINESIIHAEALLLIYPKNKLIKSYILKLKSLKNVPDVHLLGLDNEIPLVYENLKNVENEAQNKVIMKLFSVMVENVNSTYKAQKLKAS
jgi:hypothetical protein